MVKIIDNCCSLAYLDTLKNVAINSDNWNLRYPEGHPVEDKFPKLSIVDDGGMKHPILTGLAIGLLLQIYEVAGRGLFIPDPIAFCGISMKDKHTLDNIHVDNEKDENFVKILGIINSDWKEEWGGGFFHNGTSNYIKPTSFCVFEGSEPHSAEEILSDKKRFAIDFKVFRDQQSLEEVMKRENGNQ